MLTTLRITSFAAAILAVCFLALSVAFGLRSDPQIAEFLEQPGAIEKFRETRPPEEDKKQLSPLVKQAQGFAKLINPPPPPKPPEPKPAPAPTVRPEPVQEKPKPQTAKAKFEVIGTCRYPLHPHRSMALIDEPGKGLHWVIQGSDVQHVTIDQVKDGSLVCKSGDETEELFAKRPEKQDLLAASAAVGASGADQDRQPYIAPAPSPSTRGRRSRLLHGIERTRALSAESPPSREPTPRPRVRPVSKEDKEQSVEWLKKMMNDPESMGLSEDEAKNLGDLGQIINELEQEVQEEQTTSKVSSIDPERPPDEQDSPDPNSSDTSESK